VTPDRAALTDPVFYKGEWVQIDWTSQGIAGMNLLLDLYSNLPPKVAVENYMAALERKRARRDP
jgi:hypothetical protein